MPTGALKKGKHGLAGRIRKAIGASPNEPVRVTTPQFTREPGAPAIASPPADRRAWSELRTMSVTALREMGLRPWDDESGFVLLLLPGEWYSHIPEGYELVSIMNRKEKFKRGKTSDDIRFGCLAYGIKVKR